MWLDLRWLKRLRVQAPGSVFRYAGPQQNSTARGREVYRFFEKHDEFIMSLQVGLKEDL